VEITDVFNPQKGLELARLADLPNDVMVEGRRVATTLAALHARQHEESESRKISTRRKALLRVNFFSIALDTARALFSTKWLSSHFFAPSTSSLIYVILSGSFGHN
jgi:hypothetical protein